MQEEKVISVKIPVRSKMGMVYFPVRIPAGAERIIGVEYGVRMKNSFPVQNAPQDLASSFFLNPSRHIGNLRLEHPGCNGLFYATAIKEPDSMVGFADFSATENFSPWGFTHGFPRFEDHVEIPVQARIIQAIYQDKLLNKDYEVLLYIWIRTAQTRKP